MLTNCFSELPIKKIEPHIQQNTLSNYNQINKLRLCVITSKAHTCVILVLHISTGDVWNAHLPA